MNYLGPTLFELRQQGLPNVEDVPLPDDLEQQLPDPQALPAVVMHVAREIGAMLTPPLAALDPEIDVRSTRCLILARQALQPTIAVLAISAWNTESTHQSS